VVGGGTSDSGSEAFRWTSGGGMVGLGDLPGGSFSSSAYGVSADGSVVVGGGTSDSGSEAFRWTQANGMENLRDALIADGATGLDDWTLNTASAISADGQWIVGDATNSLGRGQYLARLDAPAPIVARFPDLVSLGNVNGNNKTDLGVLLRDPGTGKNKLYVMDGGSGNNIRTLSFGSATVRGSSTVSDANGDLIPEFGVLLEGGLFARVKDVVNNTLLGKPKFNANYDTVAFLSVGEAGDAAGPDVAVVGRLPATGKVQAWVKDVGSGSLVRRMGFDKAFVPFAAVAVDNVGGTNAMEIAVLGIDASGNVQAQVKDARSGKLINKIQFNKKFTPLFFAAVPNASGKLKHLAVLGRNASGVIQAQIKRVGNGTLVAIVRFSKNYDPKAFIIFADSNGSGSGEIGVVGVNASGVVRAQVKEIADGAVVNVMNFNRKYPPLDAIAVNGVAGTAQNEIVVLGQHVNGQYRLQIKDLLTGDLVNVIPVP